MGSADPLRPGQVLHWETARETGRRAPHSHPRQNAFPRDLQPRAPRPARVPVQYSGATGVAALAVLPRHREAAAQQRACSATHRRACPRSECSRRISFTDRSPRTFSTIVRFSSAARLRHASARSTRTSGTRRVSAGSKVSRDRRGCRKRKCIAVASLRTRSVGASTLREDGAEEPERTTCDAALLSGRRRSRDARLRTGPTACRGWSDAHCRYNRIGARPSSM